MVKSVYTARATTLAGGCGVSMISGYYKQALWTKEQKDRYALWKKEDAKMPVWRRRYAPVEPLGIENLTFGHGGSIIIGSFINNDACRGVYTDMCKRFPLLWQSELDANRFHGGRKFFVAAWSSKKEKQ